ncbi:MAG TPA: serine/threonine-protein kinase [Vicinamibacterales bacterium]|nr:serine/threonine-protein kinase [Vicinamibacterales bacterium]
MADRTIAHYNLLEPIGRGALGEVFRARDTRVGRTVALKLVDPQLAADDTRRLALLDEARLASRLSHPAIATLFEAGEAEGVPYLTYEFAAGVPLRSEMAGRPLPPRRALELAIQIADGLAEGHAAGVVHGDLRPDTIVVTAKGNAKLLDFGMSRWTRGGTIRRTASRSPESLPPDDVPLVSYLAPEQALGADCDGRADLFSLGTLLYEMLTGRSPFAAPTGAETVMNVVSATPQPPSAVNPDVPAELDGVILRALSKDLDRRFQSAASFSAALRGVAAKLDVRPTPRGDEYLLPVDDDADRVPASVWLIGAGGLAVLALLAWWLASSGVRA